MASLFDDAYGQEARHGPAAAGVFPLLNMYEDPDNLYVTAELPGVPAQDLELSVEKNNLTIRGERKIPEAGEKVNYHRREREAGIFRRVISLPSPVDSERVAAVSKNGVLTITLPKAAESKPRQIPISAD